MPEENDLVQYEIDLLLQMSGLREFGFSWGAAMGAALETLKSRGLVDVLGGRYDLTVAGHERARLEAARA
jgi:hypothetical protein